ncbi:MAG: NusG domain II-containing protein [Gammaproteobacteria bacterium]|nr:NusG domain II-containing protein [Gammaproteobacteria bacterium]
MKTADYLILIFALALIYTLFYRFWGSGENGQYVIIQTADEKRQYSLQHDQDIYVTGPLGGSHLQIKSGRVRFVESPCPNKVCIRHGWLERQGAVSACVPNQVMINITGDNQEYDAIIF